MHQYITKTLYQYINKNSLIPIYKYFSIFYCQNFQNFYQSFLQKAVIKTEPLMQARRQQNQSYMILTLTKQIQALSSIKLSYQNLSRYHAKIQRDFQQSISQHDYVISSLRSNLQNLNVISVRTQQERNDSIRELKDRQNDDAKLLLDTKNIAQKYQSLNQKLLLQTSRTQQNKNYQLQLQSILQTLKSHIQTLQKANQQLSKQQIQINSQIVQIKQLVEEQNNRSAVLQQQNQKLKDSIAKTNIKNDDSIDCNRKLSQQIRIKQQTIMNKNRLNRELKQKLIELKSQSQRLKNQIDYKLTLINSQNCTTNQLCAHQCNLQKMITELTQQKQYVNKQNQTLLKQIQCMQKTKSQSLLFKINSQNHLTELKKANQILLSKMEQYCIQDKEVQNLLIRKLSSLEFFCKKLNQKYQIQQNSHLQSITLKDQILFRQKPVNNLQPIKLMKNSSSLIDKLKMSNKGDTKTSQKPWLKENVA